MEADRLPQLLLSLLNPKTHRQTGTVAMARALPFCPTTCICVTCQGPAQCGQLWPLPGVPRGLGTRYTSSGKSPWATGTSHWDFPWTSPSLLFNQMYLFPLHTTALKLRKWLLSHLPEGRGQFACQCMCRWRNVDKTADSSQIPNPTTFCEKSGS